jgi:hypothetical protein
VKYGIEDRKEEEKMKVARIPFVSVRAVRDKCKIAGEQDAD